MVSVLGSLQRSLQENHLRRLLIKNALKSALKNASHKIVIPIDSITINISRSFSDPRNVFIHVFNIFFNKFLLDVPTRAFALCMRVDDKVFIRITLSYQNLKKV